MLRFLLLTMLLIYFPIIQDVKSHPIHWQHNDYRFQFRDIIPNPIRRHPNGRSQIRSGRWPTQGMVMFYSVFDYNREEICYLKHAAKLIGQFSCIPIYLFALTDRCAHEVDTLACIFYENHDGAGADTFNQMAEAGAPSYYEAYNGYVVILNQDGCSSYLGRIGGKQEIILNSGCLGTAANAIHEMMHALGYDHEQSRLDRDQYVTINVDNIKLGELSQFEKVNPGVFQDFGPYDYESLMHYPPWAFAINGNIPTIIAKQGDPDMGQLDYLGLTDKVKIRSITQCPGNTYEDHVRALRNVPNFQKKTSARAFHCSYGGDY